ncbi:aminoacetone oxidase family FAD-binding enzyme [Pseudobutyrivibrio xylanivorans]|uniref:Aminoacetone oxidase family FAD-binding enzyme n=1 Tax=Pseudobutyrivibrio xylanivorans TaxID=185007 RepID=A0A5P6VSB9_PSEXY|nr:aminoacetone oxidase family FAD-binding enzyme [Pseudobutyrivibrio xylanivorans]QFJ55595.1 aminoacetone oxidase family FAD-binding enzyme [Pseudobutyrivibrio xylanivorans]
MGNNEKTYDICIVGAGFSGLVLAIKLARAGLLVCLLDLNRIVGRRILSTGNGRCNFTNRRMGKEYFYSNSSLDFIEDKHDELRGFLRELGVIERELDGYYYPITNQAKTIRDALENEVNALNIDVFLDNRGTDITKTDDGFVVTSHRDTFNCKRVCIASGGLSAATLGSSKFGYKMANKFGMKVTKLAPSLVGLTSKDICLKDLGGVRALGAVSYRNARCEGEIQFNKDGISGYPIMCISRFIGFDELDKKLSSLSLDFVAFMSEDELKDEIKARFNRNSAATILASLNGLTNEKVTEVVVSYSRIYPDTPVSKLDDEDIENLVYNFKHFSMNITGTKGFDNSQVTAGGVELSEIDLNSMEAKKVKGLYFTGEVLDVDGICGGYNLTWAYLSADKAANAIISEV